MRRVLNSLIIVVVIYGVIAGAMFLLQRRMMYFPSHNNPEPTAVGLLDVSVETLTTQDGERLTLWYKPAVKEQPTVLFFHGNAGEIGDRADRFAAYSASGFGVAFVSWRGYGSSTGTPSETGLVTDAHTAYDWIMAQGVTPDKLVIVGESLGSGPAVHVAAVRPVGAVVLGAPYTATVDVAAQRYPWLPVRLLMKDQFRSRDYIEGISAPLLILHGTEDTVIPFAHGQRLHAMATAPVTFIALENVGHEALFHPTTWAQEIAFIRDVVFPK